MSDYTFDKNKIVGEGGRKIYLYPHYLLIHLYSIPHDEWPLPYSVIGQFKHDEVTWFYTTEDVDMWKKSLQVVLDNPAKIQKLEKYIEESAHSGLERLKNSSSLEQSLRNYYEDFQTLARVAGALRSIDRGIVFTIRENPAHANADEILRTISALTRPSCFVEEELAILKAALSIEENSAQKVWREFSHITTGYFNEKPRNINYYEQKLEEARKDNPEEKVKEIEDRIQKDKEEHQKFLKGFDNPILGEIASVSTYLKDKYKFWVNNLMNSAELLFEKAAQQLGISIDDVKNTIPPELLESIHSGKVVRTQSEEAVRNNIFLAYRGTFHELIGKDALEFESQYLKSDDTKATEFKGRVASPGSVTGPAVIVKGPGEFHKMKKDHILVVVNTSPDYVPIMHLAKGIVAEEGGLTSHVSVVSREFKIPAIVGIRGITKIIKDGDMISLDSEKGIIKILK
jgi:phosphohistidine swiveling domain-containing protein